MSVTQTKTTRSLLQSPSVRFMCGLLGVFLFFMVILSALKGIFAWFNWPSLRTAGYALITKAIWNGLRFEAAALGYLLVPAMVFFYAAGLGGGKFWKRILSAYLLVIVAVVMLIGLIDVQYFEEAGKHLTYEATEYLNASAAPILLGAFQLHPWLSTLSLLGCAALVTASWLVLRRLLGLSLPPNGARLPMATALTIPICTGLAVVAIRGGTQPRPLRIADAAITANPYINALCLDPVYAVLKTISFSNKPAYRFYNEADNIRMTRQLILGNETEPPSQPKYPLMRSSPGTPQGNRKNVVLFILESWSGKDISALGGPAGQTPFFDELARQGALFDHFYATGIRTPEGMFSILSSFPNQPLRRPIMLRRNVERVQWRPLSLILAEAGYDTVFVHGGDLTFDHMNAFLTVSGFRRLIDRNNFPESAPRRSGAWVGYDDEIVMRRANAEFASVKGRPFLGAIYTMNTHEPFVTPPDYPAPFKPNTMANKFLNALNYGDYTLKVFFEEARKETYFTNTLFLFVADHARTRDRFNFDNQHRIPFLIYAPGYVEPKTHHIVSGQLDILPTVLGLLQLNTLHAAWGQDLFSTPEERGFAVSVAGNEIRWHDRSYLLNDNLGSKPPLLFDLRSDPACQTDTWSQQLPTGEDLKKKLRAYLSLSQTLLFEDRVFSRHDAAASARGR